MPRRLKLNKESRQSSCLSEEESKVQQSSSKSSRASIIKKVKTNRKSLAQMPAVVQSKTCAICLEDICLMKKVSLDCCAHEYCYECIKQWTSDCSSSCPQCKKVIKKIGFKNVAGESMTEDIEDRVLGEPNLHCEVCRERVRMRDITEPTMPPSPNEAALCIYCD